jgi:hypothetical protein
VTQKALIAGGKQLDKQFLPYEENLPRSQTWLECWGLQTKRQLQLDRAAMPAIGVQRRLELLSGLWLLLP